VDSSTNVCVLTYQGVITNSTGEDWKDVLVALSTATPSLGGEPPKLFPLKMDYPENVPKPPVYRPTVPLSTMRRTSISAISIPPKLGIDAPLVFPRLEVPEINTSKVQTQGTSATYHIERKTTIDSDQKPHKVTIAKCHVETTPEYVVVPAKSEHAYLKASAKNTSQFQLLEGDMNVFVDGLFVTTSKLKKTSPGEEFQLYLGVDSAVKVDIKPVSKQVETTGTFFKRTTTKTSKSITDITNNKKTPVKVVVFDQIPFTSDKGIIKIKIEYPDDPSSYTLTEDSIMKRQLSLNPGEKKKLKLNYSIETPSETPVYYVAQPVDQVNY